MLKINQQIVSNHFFENKNSGFFSKLEVNGKRIERKLQNSKSIVELRVL